MSEANTASDGALAGVRVIDLTINVLGPMATLMLGEMGADVIKIEAPGGDPTRALGARRNPGMAAHFVQFNRSKRSVELDLKSPAGKEAFLKLIDTADVFVHNMRAEAAVPVGERSTLPGWIATAAVAERCLPLRSSGPAKRQNEKWFHSSFSG